MKVAIYMRDEFTDADREQIAVLLDGYRSNRLASRDELKGFYETHGAQWKAVLEHQYAALVQQDMEDLI